MPIASVFTGLFIAAATVLAVILVVWLFLTLNRIRASLENINRLLMHIAIEVHDMRKIPNSSESPEDPSLQ